MPLSVPPPALAAQDHKGLRKPPSLGTPLKLVHKVYILDAFNSTVQIAWERAPSLCT